MCTRVSWTDREDVNRESVRQNVRMYEESMAHDVHIYSDNQKRHPDLRVQDKKHDLNALKEGKKFIIRMH